MDAEADEAQPGGDHDGGGGIHRHDGEGGTEAVGQQMDEDDAQRREIISALEVAPLSVTVPQTPFKAGTAGTTAAIVGLFLAPFTGGLSLAATGAALGAGALMGSGAATQEDIVGTKTNLCEAAAAEHRRLARAGETVFAVVDSALGPVPCALQLQGGSQLAALIALDEHYRLLASSTGAWT